MAIFAILDENNVPNAFYREDVHGYKTIKIKDKDVPNPDCVIPDTAIEISEDHWVECLQNSGLRQLVKDKSGNVQIKEYVKPLTEDDLIAYASNRRWMKEVGGITVDGMAISTDDRSKTMISYVLSSSGSDPDFKTSWKMADGTFKIIDAKTIGVISDAVRAHVSDCFKIESTVIDGIIKKKIKTFKQIDSAFETETK